jgi:hypothetical protein
VALDFTHALPYLLDVMEQIYTGILILNKRKREKDSSIFFTYILVSLLCLCPSGMNMMKMK